jgi:hypothetical protein
MTTIDICSCSFLFDHHIELKNTCPKHESYFTTHG